MASPDVAPREGPKEAIPFDGTLFEELARMTPDERLAQNDRMAAAILELRLAFAAAPPEDAPRPARGERD